MQILALLSLLNSLFIAGVRVPLLLHPKLTHTLLSLLFPFLGLLHFILSHLLSMFSPSYLLLFVSTCHLVLVQGAHLLQQGEGALLLSFENDGPRVHIRRSRSGLGKLGF